METIFQPLGDTGATVHRGLEKAGLDAIGAFGSCGDPRNPNYTSWRSEFLIPGLKKHGLGLEDVFNPEVEEWDPSLAALEARHLGRDTVIALPVTNQTPGAASIAEAGLAGLAGLLRGQKVDIHIQLTPESPEPTYVARRLALSGLSEVTGLTPHVMLHPDIDTLVQASALNLLKSRKEQRRSADHPLLETQQLPVIPPPQGDLSPGVFMYGTSGTKKPEWMKVVADGIKGLIKDSTTLSVADVPIEDSYVRNWDAAIIGCEDEKKQNYAVQVLAITGETESLGALAEVGPSAMRAVLSGQDLLIYIESHPSDPKSDTNRARKLVAAHLETIRGDFPKLPIQIATSPKELSLLAVASYLRRR